MMNQEHTKENDEPEISQLREWLSKVNGEYLAYLKGATKALLYVQESQGKKLDPKSLSFENLRGD